MSDFEIQTLSLIIKPKGESLFSERATIVAMDDEAAGCFIKINQQYDESRPGEIRFDVEEWPKLSEAIRLMILECRKNNDHNGPGVPKPRGPLS